MEIDIIEKILGENYERFCDNLFAPCEQDITEAFPAEWDKLYEYFINSGDMPYGTAKARDGNPYEWMVERLYQILKGGLDK